MSEQQSFNESRFVERIALWFVWLVVLGGSLLGIGMLLLHELGPHG